MEHRLLVLASFLFLALLSTCCSGAPEAEALVRTRRDVVCATGGKRLCSVYCKARGKKGGDCAWDLESAGFECTCSKELRGIRCNLGGGYTCHASCLVMGYSSGECDSTQRCMCGGGNTRWGDVISHVRERL